MHPAYGGIRAMTLRLVQGGLHRMGRVLVSTHHRALRSSGTPERVETAALRDFRPRLAVLACAIRAGPWCISIQPP